MGKVSPKDSKISARKKKSKGSNNKYLKPGTLVQLSYTKASATAKSCNDLAKKRVPVFDTMPARNCRIAAEHINSPRSPLISSAVNIVKRSNLVRPMKFDDLQVESSCMKNNNNPLMLSPMGFVMQNNLLRTPKTPQHDPCNSESQFESLPMELLVKIVCNLHHDQLKAVFHVSQRIRQATVIARQYHFNYTTPDRSRQEMLSVMTPMPINRRPFPSKGDGNPRIAASPHTPKAPRHAPRPPTRSNVPDMKQVTAVLFQEQTALPSRCLVPSVLKSASLFKPLPPKHPRVLFYEDELCQAVAQNNLR